MISREQIDVQSQNVMKSGGKTYLVPRWFCQRYCQSWRSVFQTTMKLPIMEIMAYNVDQIFPRVLGGIQSSN